MMRRCYVSSLRSLLKSLNPKPSLKPHRYNNGHHFHFSSPLAKLSPNSSIRESHHHLCSCYCPRTLIGSRFLSTRREETQDGMYETEDHDWVEEWEEEEETDPVIGDGGDGGGVVLGNVNWGEKALKIANDILSENFSDDVALYAFKVSPKGYVYVRLDKLSHKYGCPSIEEIERFNNMYKQRLDEIIEKGEIALDLAIEVSSPGAERLIKVPDDLDRFKNMPMHVQYIEEDSNSNSNGKQNYKERVLLLESVDDETMVCVWKLADVKENRAEAGKGRPLNRKMKDWRLEISFEGIKRVMLYLHSK